MLFGKKTFLFVLFILIFSSFSYANFYADVVIDVDSYGLVSIDGISNHPMFLNVSDSEEFTSKNGKYWVLNISSDEVFEDYIYELKLPEYAQINYFKSGSNFRIDSEGNRVVLIGLGTDREFEILVQYSIDEYKKETGVSKDSIIYSLLVLLVFCIILFSVYIFGMKKESKEIKAFVDRISKDKDEDKKKVARGFNYDILSDRQKQIVDIVLKKKKVSQKELEEEMGIPKSSVSRNVSSLVTRGVLKKERVGQTSYVFLND